MISIENIVRKLQRLHSVDTETPTSFTLARDILANMDVNWASKLNILDPACGRGTMLLAALEKLVEHGHDPATAVGMLHGSDSKMIQVKIATNALLLASDTKPNIYFDDSLRRDWNMKFDVIIGNPPYQDSSGQNTLYPKFYAKALELLKEDGQLAFITPPAIIPGLWGLKDVDGITMPEPKQIKLIAVGDKVKKHFPRKVSSQFCYFVISNSRQIDNSKVKVITDTGELIANGPLFPKAVNSSDLQMAQSIINTCFRFNNDPYGVSSSDHGRKAHADPNGQDLAVESISTNGKIKTRPITWTGKHPHYGKPKVIMPMYGKTAVVDHSHKLVSAAQEKVGNATLTGHNIVTIPTKSDAESENLLKLLESRLQRFFSSVTGETRSPYIAFLKNFIGVTLDQTHDDDSLEIALGLTDEQREYLRENF